MKKIILISAALCMALTSSVFAEQPAADEYRQTLKSGNFVLDYERVYYDENGNKLGTGMNTVLAAKNNMRMVKSDYKARGGVGGLFKKDGKKDYPDTLYRDGKYYRFDSKKEATMALWNQLQDPNIDPSKGWNMIQYSLAIPDTFNALWAYDAYRQVSNVVTAPHFIQTVKRTIDDKEYICDVYSLPIKSHTGTILAENIYYYYYDQGKLIMIDEYFKNNGSEYRRISLKVNEITNAPTEELFMMPQGCKVYAVGVGDMNDLLDQKVEIESY